MVLRPYLLTGQHDFEKHISPLGSGSIFFISQSENGSHASALEESRQLVLKAKIIPYSPSADLPLLTPISPVSTFLLMALP